MDFFALAPRALQFKINDLLNQLWVATRDEAATAFIDILEKNSTLQLYSLGLFYNAGSWSYMVPTFASEQGLEQVAERYSVHSPGTIAEEKISLRWSPCDSPHHGEQGLDDLMPKSSSVLNQLSIVLADSDPMLGNTEWPTSVMEDNDLFYRFIASVRATIRTTVIAALLEAKQNKKLHDFFELNQCALTLNAGDISNEDFLDNIQALNSNTSYQRVVEDIKAADQIQMTLTEKWQQKQLEELDNPATTELTPADFSDILDQFQPTFIEQSGGVYIDRDYPFPLQGDSESEEISNRLELMKLLQPSPHFEELHQLYGHFMGKQFEPGDLLPTLCRELCQRLGHRLIKQYKDRTFRVFMSVDRNSLYRMTFVTLRDDGFEFFLTPEGLDGGVEEIHEFNARKDLLASIPG